MATNATQEDQKFEIEDLQSLGDVLHVLNLTHKPKDLTIRWSRNPNTGDLTIKSGSNAVKEQLKNLILTRKFERPFQPGLGSNIMALLFEPHDIITEQLIADEIRTVVENYQPNVDILDIIVNSDRAGAGYRVKIIFAVINEKEPVTFETFLESTRGT
tara:strand:- start:230 stop:703 length:474 start_codon:yes stop_codon:yes gene_type:complete